MNSFQSLQATAESVSIIKKTLRDTKAFTGLVQQMYVDNERKKRDPYAKARRSKGEKRRNASRRLASSLK